MFYRSHGKRITDVTLAGILVVLLIVPVAVVLLLYLATFNFPVFFVQDRVGLNERPFRLIKFRTLRAGPGQLMDRQFLLGRFLRFLSLDEIPQIINVLRGEMSFIGPRPLPIAYLPLFRPWQRVRHQVRPGITGLAQVSGRHGISWEQKFRYDVEYVRNLSIILDIRIGIRTIALLLSLKPDRSLDEKPFDGQ